MQIEDILNILCGQVELRQTNDFQKVFVIKDARAARLALEVLTSHGIESKLYPEENESKLYVTNPADPAVLEQKLPAAAAYATALKAIGDELDALCEGAADILKSPYYTIAFGNSPAPGGKQIIISITPAAAAAGAPKPAVAAPVPASAPVKTVAAASANPKLKAAKKYVRQEEVQSMFSGPQLLRDNNKILTKKEKEKQKQTADSYWRQLWLYIKGNSAVAASIIVVVIIILLSLFSMFVVSKGFLCGDLAHISENKTAWYCAK